VPEKWRERKCLENDEPSWKFTAKDIGWKSKGREKTWLKAREGVN